MPNIPELSTKGKVLADKVLQEWGIAGIIVLVGLASFGLGRISAQEQARMPVAIEQATPVDVQPSMPIGGQYVASANGSVYYFPWCSGAQKIATSNQRWFPSESAAQAAGYVPAKNCPGLEAH
jgi:hypothetical protein